MAACAVLKSDVSSCVGLVTGDGRDNAEVALEDQVVQVGGGDGPQGRQFGRGIVCAEDVQGPDPDRGAPQVRVVEGAAEEGLQGDGRNAGLFLFRPAQGPQCAAVAADRALDAAETDAAAAQKQGGVDFIQGLAGVGVEVADGRSEELFLVGPADGTVAMGAVAQVGEVPQKEGAPPS